MARKTVFFYILLMVISRFGSWLTLGTYSLFLQGHGLDLMQINLVNATFYVTMLLCEIPTGAIADLYGRKFSFVASCLMKAVGLTVYGFSSTMPGFILAETLAAIGMCLENGAFQSWLVDGLNHYGYQGDRSAIISRGEKWSTISAAVAVIVGAEVASINMAYAWFLAGFMLFVCGVLALFLMREDYFQKKSKYDRHISKISKTSLRGIRLAAGNKVIVFLFSMSLLQFLAVQAPNMQWAPYMKRFVGTQENVGFIATFILLSLAAGAYLVEKFAKRIARKDTAICWIQGLVGFGLITAVIFKPFSLILPAFLFHELGRGIFKPLKTAYLHDNISDSSLRATTASFESLACHIGGIVGLLASGWIAKSMSIHSAWMASGSFLILATAITFLFYRKTK